MKYLSLSGIFVSLACSFVSVLCVIQPFATAFPGQTVQQVQQMVRESNLFQSMSLSEDPLYPGYYFVSGSYDGGEVNLTFFEDDDGISHEQALQVRYPDTDVSFERDSASGLDLILSVWGSEVVQDFANSRYTDEIRSPLGHDEHFYLGETYGYSRTVLQEARTGKSISTLTIMTTARWQEATAFARLCASNPNHVECAGLGF
ncbi:MAG: hypothetical protein F6K30_27505 [Cyanothece sp. SIO2G6]|nr:hypothetical protein [Cyanothece sp. SIO2G6]